MRDDPNLVLRRKILRHKLATSLDDLLSQPHHQYTQPASEILRTGSHHVPNTFCRTFQRCPLLSLQSKRHRLYYPVPTQHRRQAETALMLIVPMTDGQYLSLIKNDALTQCRRCRCDAKRGEAFGGNDGAGLVACQFCDFEAFFRGEEEDVGQVLACDGSSRPGDLITRERHVELLVRGLTERKMRLRIASHRALL